MVVAAGFLIGRLLGAGVMEIAEANAARVALGMEEKGLQLGEEAPPIWISVQSSAIRGVGFIPPDTIIVQFMRGGTYSYDGSLELFTQFVTAPSKGSFFNEHFK